MERWRASRIIAMLVFGLMVLMMTPYVAVAGHVDAATASAEEAVCGLLTDIDELLVEFDQKVGDFDDDRLNRALFKAELHVIAARSETAIPDLTAAFRQLRAAMRELEKGASVPVSGNGFADDLGSLGSFFAQVFVVELISVTAELGTVDPETTEAATFHYELGAADRADGQWEAALTDFTRAVREIDSEVVIGAPCSTTGT